MTQSHPCPCCGEEFVYHGVHWSKSECTPVLTQRQKDILTGLLMGDGWMKRENDKWPSMHVAMVSKSFLQWVADELSWAVSSVSEYRSSSEAASISGGNEENYSDQYLLRSRAFPDMEEFMSWYSEGQKRFPNDIDITPLIMKMWYCCDGGVIYSNSEYNETTCGICRISAVNESDRPSILREIISDAGLSCNISNGRIRFRRDESHDFLDYIGDPVPGFEHKWIIDDRVKYMREKKRV